MKLFAIFIILMLLAGTAGAWEVKNGTATLTEDELINVIATAQKAGGALTEGLYAKTLYESNVLTYSTYWSAIQRDNELIAIYNAMIQEHFNTTMYAKMKVLEYSI